MSRNKSFYITTTLPYVNAEPHIGHALELIHADVMARYWREKLGDGNVFFNTGTDEHGQKIFEAAQKAGKDIKEYVDYYAGKFEQLKQVLNLSNDAFIRTTDENHIKATKEMWKLCKKDIYEKEFEGLYCVGCERFLAQRDLIDGKCHIHQTEPHRLKEKNWFFNFKKYEKNLLKYLENPDVIIPDWRREEAINFVKDGLEDFSISREKKQLSWGVPVPDDDTQIMYVWFDALTNYISTLGWPNDLNGDFKKFWEEGYIVQMAGKDQVRFQSLMWQAMLMSADIKTTDQIFYHGFINSGGQKMSKSLGNVISPYELIEKYGTDATRYLLLRHVHSTEDTDITWEKLDEWYTASLVNGLGNLVARIMQLAQTYLREAVEIDTESYPTEYSKLLQNFEINKAIDYIWHKIGKLDLFIQETKPWKSKDKNVIKKLVVQLLAIASLLKPFMPETSKAIKTTAITSKKPKNLFPRLR